MRYKRKPSRGYAVAFTVQNSIFYVYDNENALSNLDVHTFLFEIEEVPCQDYNR